jgi:hypothetical protein
MLSGLSTLCRYRWFLDNRLWRVHNLRLTVRWILCVYSLLGPLLYVLRLVLPRSPAAGEDTSPSENRSRSIQMYAGIIIAIIGPVPGLLATYIAFCLALNRDFRKWRPAPL